MPRMHALLAFSGLLAIAPVAAADVVPGAWTPTVAEVDLFPGTLRPAVDFGSGDGSPTLGCLGVALSTTLFWGSAAFVAWVIYDVIANDALDQENGTLFFVLKLSAGFVGGVFGAMWMNNATARRDALGSLSPGSTKVVVHPLADRRREQPPATPLAVTWNVIRF